MKKKKDHWVPRVREMAAEHPTWSEVELTWALIEEMGVRGAGILAPVCSTRWGTSLGSTPSGSSLKVV